MSIRAPVTVHLVYSPRPRAVLTCTLTLPAGSTVWQAIETSGWLQSQPEIDLGSSHAVGLWGRKTTPGHVLHEGDRIEITRALLVDPKHARRERFQQQGVGRAGLFAKRRPGAKAGY